MRQRRGIVIIGAALFVAVLSLGTISVYAEDSANSSNQYPDSSDNSDDQSSSSSTSARDKARQEIESLRNEMKEAKERVQNVKDRLAGRRLEACEKHQAAIARILTRAATRGENHIALFSTIATRVENFYVKKGKTLTTYDQLVNEVNAKRTAAQTTVDAVKTAGVSFTCSSDNPKAQVAVFRTEIKAEIAALKDYRTAVKNLIVGVKSVQSTSENGA